MSVAPRLKAAVATVESSSRRSNSTRITLRAVKVPGHRPRTAGSHAGGGAVVDEARGPRAEPDPPQRIEHRLGAGAGLRARN
jgi:hypothetical protein